MNSNIYKVFFIAILYFFSGCKPSIYIDEEADVNNGGTGTIEWNLRKNMTKKKTGVYIYPKLGTKISLKKGKFNGVFQIIEKTDTLFYCNYINNLPTGRYIKNFYYPYFYRYYRTLPLKPKIDYDDGKGFFNEQHKKEGIWIEDLGHCTQQGSYINGKKEGVWKEYCFQDVGGYHTERTLLYKNDSIVSFIENQE